MRPLKVFLSILRWVIAVAVLVAIWQYLLLGHISSAFFGSPRATYDVISGWAHSGVLWQMVTVTLEEASIGFVIGTVIGLIVGLGIGVGPAVLSRLLEPIVSGLYAMPKLILAPLLYVAMGVGVTPKIFIVVLSVFPVTAMYTVTGVRTVSTETVRAVRLFGANRRQLASKVLLPHTSGYIISAVLFSVVHAITVAIGAEILFGASTGIGGMLATETGDFQATGVLGALVVGTVVSAVVLGLVRVVSTRLTRAGYSPSGEQEMEGAGVGM